MSTNAKSCRCRQFSQTYVTHATRIFCERKLVIGCRSCRRDVTAVISHWKRRSSEVTVHVLLQLYFLLTYILQSSLAGCMLPLSRQATIIGDLSTVARWVAVAAAFLTNRRINIADRVSILHADHASHRAPSSDAGSARCDRDRTVCP